MSIEHQPIKLGFVGLSATGGWASRSHVPALSHPSLRSTFTISAVHTSTETSAAAAQETYSKAWPALQGTYHGADTTAIANDPEVDVVAVSVKAPDHREIVEKAVAAGKHVFIEYPPGRTLEESENMRMWVNRNGKLQVMVGLQGTQSAAMRKVKKILDSGKIGKVLSTTVIANIPREARFWQPEVAEDRAYMADKYNGATLLSIAAAHHLASFISILGPLDSVSATSSTQYPSVDIVSHGGEVKTLKSNCADHYAFSGALKNGAHASVTWRSGSKSAPGRTQFLWIIDGEEGSVKLESDATMPPGCLIGVVDPQVTVNGQGLDEYIKAEGIENDEPGIVLEEGEKGTLVEFVRRSWVEFGKTLRGGKGEFATLDDAIEVQRVVDAVERSAEHGGLGIKLN